MIVVVSAVAVAVVSLVAGLGIDLHWIAVALAGVREPNDSGRQQWTTAFWLLLYVDWQYD